MRTTRALVVISIAWATCVCVSLPGCTSLRSQWSDDEHATEPVGLAAPKLDAGATILDVAFVSFLTEHPTNELIATDQTKVVRSDVEEVWRWIDETAIAPEIRSALNLNGLRAGRVHTQSEFTRALNAIRRSSQDGAERLLDAAAVGSDVSHASRRIPCRMGRRYELPVRQPAAGEVSTLVSLRGDTIGRTLETPQPLFAITIQPTDSSGVRLRMQPEIQFGAMRQTWVGSDSALRIDNRRESWVLEDLAFELEMASGGTLVIGATPPSCGLGEQMFTGKTADGEVDRVLAVIRIAQLPDIMSNTIQ